MSQVDAKFSCEGCGKTYKWKPEFAGRKVKCKCGFVMTAPKAPPQPPHEDEPDLDALYSLAEDGHKAATAAPPSIRCPSCRSEIEPGASICTQCGFNLKTGKKASTTKASASPVPALAAAGGATAAAAVGGGGMFGFPTPKRGLQQEDVGDNKVLDLYLPLGMLAFGIFGVFAQYMWFGDTVHNFAGALPLALVDIVVSCVVLAFGCLIAIKMLDVAFGSPGTAALKIAAIALAPAAISGLIGYMIGGAAGEWIGRIFAIAAYFALFYYLFDMDMGEVLTLSAILFFVRIFIAPFLLFMIMGAMFASAVSGMDEASRNDDKWVADANDNMPTDDATAWLKDNSGRMFGGLGHDASVKLIDDLLAVGCTGPKCLAYKGSGQTRDMWVKLPRDKAKRKQAFDIYNKFCKDRKMEEKKDGGQTYLLMEPKIVDIDFGDLNTKTKGDAGLKIVPLPLRPPLAA